MFSYNEFFIVYFFENTVKQYTRIRKVSFVTSIYIFLLVLYIYIYIYIYFVCVCMYIYIYNLYILTFLKIKSFNYVVLIFFY